MAGEATNGLYKEALEASWLFYEAQISGEKPAWSRVQWRGSSHVSDPVPGGWYDAGDFLKCSLPMATSVTLLAWGMLDFEEGHRVAGCLETGRRGLRWAADYLVACRLGPRAYVGLVGDPARDHGSWTRPEDSHELRPAWIWREGMPAADLLGAVAAALAACSLVFQKEDSVYSKSLLTVAEDLYAWGETCPPGQYNFQRTPGGLVCPTWSSWGRLSYACGGALMACVRARYCPADRAACRSFAREQLDYCLGSTGRSFVVGVGRDPPKRPHHRAASCPPAPATCSWDCLHTPGPNPHVLRGALVGGPADGDDSYRDDRQDYRGNEVALTYNAAYTSALAAMLCTV